MPNFNALYKARLLVSLFYKTKCMDNILNIYLDVIFRACLDIPHMELSLKNRRNQ